MTKKFGTWLRHRREEKHFTQRWLSQQADISCYQAQ